MFLLYDKGLWCPVYCLGRFCFFVLVDSIRYVALSSWFVSTNFGTCSYHCPFSHFAPLSSRMLKHGWAHTLHVSSCIVLLPILRMLVKCGLFSLQISYILCLFFRFHLVIFFNDNLVCNAWYFAAIISLSVSAIRFPLDSRRNVSSSLMSWYYYYYYYFRALQQYANNFFDLRTESLQGTVLEFACCNLSSDTGHVKSSLLSFCTVLETSAKIEIMQIIS